MASTRIAAATLALTFSLASTATAQEISFLKGTLDGATPDGPTTLQFGPDGRLYVGERYGQINIYTVSRTMPGEYTVTDTEVLNQVYNKPNRTDDGALDPITVGRQMTGILVVGTAQNPVIYAASSDPRVAVGVDSGLDTNSGIITRLTWNGSSWDELDIVRGLPRCEENHASNGMALDPLTNTLYLGQGGHTNMGAPSNNFGFTPEYALSAAILSIDLDAIGNTTYDLPTLDDPTRSNSGPGGSDVNDPWGGNDGANQAMIVAGGPVQVYASGLRNPYDVLIHSNGFLYTVDNGPNTGWGGPPLGCTNDPNEANSAHYPDALHKIGTLGDGGGYYAGHPNLFRGGALINGQSPIPAGAADSNECNYLIPGVNNGSMHTWNSSTNGVCEYTASNFSGAMQGDLLTVTYSWSTVERVQLNPDGSMSGVNSLFSSVGATPLDVIAQGDGEIFPGTIWIANYADGAIVAFEPTDLEICSGAYSLVLDDDGDGYSNADEEDNGSDPCSAADVPADWDGDFISDINDLDDDNDGDRDDVDPYALDPFNGMTTTPPLSYGWAVGDPGTGFFGMGFTGLMSNGSTDYLDQFTPTHVIAGGAAGKFTVDHVDAGDALGNQNDQMSAFQLGVDVSGVGPFTIRTSVEAPFFGGLTPVAGQSHGMYFGTGTQDDYVKLVLAAGDGSGQLELVIEEGGVVTNTVVFDESVLGAQSLELFFDVDPIAETFQPMYRADGGALVALGSALAVPNTLTAAFDGVAALAVGVIATNGGSGQAYAATWDLIEVNQNTTARAAVAIGPAGGGIDASTYSGGSFRIENNSPDGQEIEAVTIDLSSAIYPDMVFDPDGLAGDTASKGFTPDSGSATVGLIGHAYGGAHDGGYDRITITFDDFQPGEVFTFSVDVDPTTIQGSAPPGPNDSGSVSGLECTGSKATVSFDDGAAISGSLFHTLGSASESEADIRSALPPVPTLQVVGHGSGNMSLGGVGQLLRVGGPTGSTVRAFISEGGLFLSGLPGGGFDVDPFEANSAVGFQEVTGVIGAGGIVDLPVVLGDSSAEAGLNLITAVIEAPDGATGGTAPAIIVDIEPSGLAATPPNLPFPASLIDVTTNLSTFITNSGAGELTVSSLEIQGSPDFTLGTTPQLPFALAGGGGGASISVLFTPTSSGQHSASLLVHHDGLNSPLLVPLTGAGSEPDADVLYRVNCGGPEIAAADGSSTPWSADTGGTPSPFVNSGETNSTFTTGATLGKLPSVPPPAPLEIFASERYDANGGSEMEWEFPLPPGTIAEVRLYFAEIYSGITGGNQRVFDVNIEGEIMSSVDPIFEADGFLVGYVRSAVVKVDDGTLDIDFLHVIQNPAIKAIEIRKPNSLVASLPQLSRANGTTQDLELSLGLPFAGQTYLVMTSATGAAPGIPLGGGIVLPLNFDGIVLASIENAGSSPWIDTIGTLDADGRATAAFDLPLGLPAGLTGLTLHHAAVLLDAGSGDVVGATVAVPAVLID